MAKKKQGDAMDETQTTGETPVSQHGAGVKVKKVKGGAGVNHSLGCFVQLGGEYDVSVEVAAQCILGREFELVDQADAQRVGAAVEAIKARDFPKVTTSATETGN